MVLQPTPLLRPVAFEYWVRGSLDGATLAPPVRLPPDRASPLSSVQFIRQEVENLGLIDLTGGGIGGQYAGRIVKWIQIAGPNNPTSPNNVGIAFDGTEQRNELTIPALANGIFSSVCIFVPQTGQLRLDGMEASPDNPVVVKIQVWQPRTLSELTEMIETCCCRSECENQFGDPCFIHALYSAPVAEREIASVNPPALVRGISTIVTIDGQNLHDGDRVSITQLQSLGPMQNHRSSVTVRSVEVIGNTANVSVSVPVNIPLGMYDVALAPELAPQWATLAIGAIEVTD